MQLEQFRTKLKEYLRESGYSQKQLAYKLGLHPTQLSNKLNENNNAHLTRTEVKQVVKKDLIKRNFIRHDSKKLAQELMKIVNNL